MQADSPAMPPAISIIVPVYNGADYVEACVRSIQAQTLNDWELIIIDDGSTDHSGPLCDALAQQDARIRVVHKANEGVSRARNAGLQMARGAYVAFVDADDRILPTMLQRLHEEAQKGADIVMCDAVTVYQNGRREADTITRLAADATLSKDSFTAELLSEMAGAVWRCLYRRDMLEKYQVFFPEGLKFSEDRLFNLHAFACARSICYLKEGLYERLIHEKSACHRFHPDYYEHIRKAARAAEARILTSWKGRQDILVQYRGYFVTGAIAAINNYFYKTSTFSRTEKRAALRHICDDAELRDAISRTQCGGHRGQWILRRNYILLELAAYLANWKHKR